MSIGQELLKACKSNDRRAQHQLYKLSFHFLMKVCSRYVHNKEDALSYLNNGFLKILTNLDKYKTEIPFESWAKKVMIHSVIDEFRKNKNYMQKEVHRDFTLSENDCYIDSSEADSKLSAEDIYKLIKELPPMTASVFNLYVIDGYNHREIGEMLGISEGTSKWHLSNARVKLKEKIKRSVISIVII
jgi:RNA polymerase sigma factor (sigma-70 family)